MSAEHEEYISRCKSLDFSMEEIVKRRKELKTEEFERVGNLPKNEVSLAEHEWWQDMRRDSPMSTRMY